MIPEVIHAIWLLLSGSAFKDAEFWDPNWKNNSLHHSEFSSEPGQDFIYTDIIIPVTSEPG